MVMLRASDRFDWSNQPRNKSSLKLFYVLFFVVLFLFAPLYPLKSPGGSGLFLPFNTAVWFALTAFIASALVLAVYYRAIYFSPAIYPGIVSIVLMISSGFVVEVGDKVEWLFRVGAALGGLLFVISLFQLRRIALNLTDVLFVIAISTFCFAFLSAFSEFQDSFSVTPFLQPFARLGGVFDQANLNASAMSTGIMVSVMLLDIRYSEKFSINGFLYVVIFLCTVSMVAAGSRAGVLGLAGGFGTLFLSRAWSRANLRVLVLGAFVILAGAGLGVTATDGWGKTHEKFERMSGEDVRYYMYLSSLRLALEAPFVGHGYGNFERTMADQLSEENIGKEYRGEHLVSLGNQSLSHPHNEVLYWAVEGGIIGLFVIFSFFSFVFLSLFRCQIKKGLAYLGLLFPLLVHVLVELPFYLSTWHWLVFLTLVTLGFIERDVKVYRFGRSFAALLFVLVVFNSALLLYYFAGTLSSISDMNKYIEDSPSSPDVLASASKNIYFSEFAGLMLARHMFYEDVESGSTSFTPIFISTAENYLERNSRMTAYYDLVLAYYLLGRNEESRELAREALLIYPESKELKLMRSNIGQNALQ